MARYIDADALHDFVNEEFGDDVPYEWAWALTVVDHAPTIEARPVVRGEWEQCFEDWRKQIEGDKCSACGFEHYGCSVKHYHFCPNCGADMRGEEDG